MKLVTGLVRPFKLAEVREALLLFGHVAAMAEVKAYTPRRDESGAISHGGNTRAFFPKVKVEVLVPDAEAERAVEVIRHAAMTGRMGEGDGLVYVSDVEHAVRIRTGDVDERAL